MCYIIVASKHTLDPATQGLLTNKHQTKNIMANKKLQKRIDQLVADNDAESLADMAGNLGIASSGTKTEIATRIAQKESAGDGGGEGEGEEPEKSEEDKAGESGDAVKDDPKVTGTGNFGAQGEPPDKHTERTDAEPAKADKE